MPRHPSFSEGSGGRRSDRKEPKKQPNLVIPVIIGLFVVGMVTTLILKGRSARGGCQWDHVAKKATCKGKQMRTIPTDIPDAVLTLHMGTKLDKSENEFTILAADNFSSYLHLEELRLIKCGIEDIHSGAFKDLTSLRRLDLRYNRLQSLTEATFSGLHTLEYLYLSNNPITSLVDHVFRGLRIEHLVLGNNPALTEVSPRAFAGGAVRSAVFNRCSISVLHKDTFDPIEESLQELYITHNMQPLALPSGIFDGLRLQKLTLAGNGLTETGCLKGLVATEIQLDDNNLNDFTTLGCIGLRETRRLSLVRCGLRRLSRENFSSLSGLQELDLEGNDLTLLDAKVFEVLPQLRVLDLADNDLEEFAGNFSNVLPEVDSIALQGNDLRTLPESMQPLFSRLRNLTLQGNPFHCNCELHWLARWLEQDSHRSTLEDVEAVTCATPEARNFTTVSDYGFQCRAPAVFNATFDNDGITLLCTAEGDPPPTVTWVSPGGAEKSTIPPPWQREVFKTRSSLTISRDGNYTCIASNLVGEDSITVNTRKMPSSGLKFHVESREIEILQTQTGFTITFLLIAILGYIVRCDSLTTLADNPGQSNKKPGAKANGKNNGEGKKKSGK